MRKSLFILGKVVDNRRDMSGRKSSNDTFNDSNIETLDRTETREPVMYKVIILNDDYTPMDFVIFVLKSIFNHDDRTAEKIMLDVHKKGAGVAGIYTHEVAETKSYQMNTSAKENKYPLKSFIEAE